MIDDTIQCCIAETRKMFSRTVGFADSNNIIKHFIAILPRPESPYEQAKMYRKLVGIDSPVDVEWANGKYPQP